MPLLDAYSLGGGLHLSLSSGGGLYLFLSSGGGLYLFKFRSGICVLFCFSCLNLIVHNNKQHILPLNNTIVNTVTHTDRVKFSTLRDVTYIVHSPK